MSPSHHPGPGADDAGCYGEPLPPPEGGQLRALVSPGPHRVAVFVMVRAAGGREMHSLRLDVDVDVVPHERAFVSFELDLSVTPPLLVRSA